MRDEKVVIIIMFSTSAWACQDHLIHSVLLTDD